MMLEVSTDDQYKKNRQIWSNFHFRLILATAVVFFENFYQKKNVQHLHV